jgi:AraC-like DNA-binding protein
MPEHIHYQVLYRGATVSIRDVRCRPTESACSDEEQATRHTVVFPRAGMFVKHVGSQQVVADCNHVLFFNGGEPYRVSHPVAGGDDCTSFAFSHEVLLDALSRYEPQVRDRPELPFRLTHGPIESSSLFGHQKLRQGLRTRTADGLRVEELSLGLLDEVVESAYRLRGHRPVPTATARLHRERAEAAKVFLASRFRMRPALAEVARAVHCSPYHLARLFRREVGVPLHQYLNRLRLGAALESLADGATDLTALALDLGYASHSHFSEAFRRAFGAAPSAFRGTVTSVRLRQMSKHLIG